MNNKKHTAVEQLIIELDEISRTCPMSNRQIYLYCKSLAMAKLATEKQQVIDAYIDGYSASQHNADSNKYFNDTYGE